MHRDWDAEFFCKIRKKLFLWKLSLILTGWSDRIPPMYYLNTKSKLYWWKIKILVYFVCIGLRVEALLLNKSSNSLSATHRLFLVIRRQPRSHPLHSLHILYFSMCAVYSGRIHSKIEILGRDGRLDEWSRKTRGRAKGGFPPKNTEDLIVAPGNGRGLMGSIFVNYN